MDNQEGISEAFIEEMVDRVIKKINDKLEQLDISLDYIAAALLDVDAASIAARTGQLGRMAKLPRTPKDTDRD